MKTSCPSKSSFPQQAFLLFLFSLLGYAGNYFSLPISYNVDFIFGSVFSLIALRLMGPPGIIVAFIASTYTYQLWHHPYAIVIFTAEAAFVMLALKKGRSNILIITVAYWLCVGIPLVVAFYGGIMQLGAQSTLVIALKQSLNGIFNALIACTLLSHLPVRKWLGIIERKKSEPLYQVISNTIAATFLFPAIIAICFFGQNELEKQHERAIQALAQETKATERVLTRWFDYRVRALTSLAEGWSRSPQAATTNYQNQLKEFLDVFPEFHNAYLADGDATTVAFSPPLNEKGESTIGLNFKDRKYFEELQQTKGPVVSDVFQGRGGVFSPIFTIAVPVVQGGNLFGFGLGAIDLNKMGEFLETVISNPELNYTLVDHSGTVVISTVADRTPLQPIPDLQEGATVKQVGAVALRVPGIHKHVSIMSTWKGAAYFTEQQLKNGGWRLIMEYPLAPLQQAAYADTIYRLYAMALLFIISIFLSWWLSRLIASMPQRLASISHDLPGKIAARETIAWPQSNILEFQQLSNNFQKSANALSQRLEFVEKHSQILEEKVAERTARLQASESRFRLLFHGHAAVFLLVDPENGSLLDANKSAADFYGYSIDELKQLKISDINIMSDEDVAEKISEAATAKANHFIFSHRLKGGEIRTVETYATLISLEEKPVLFSVIHDISERQKAEDALVLERTHLRTLVNTMPDMVWLKDRNGKYLACNHRFEQFFGAALEDIKGKTDYDFIDKALADFFRENDRKAMLAGCPTKNEEVVPFASDGHTEHLETIKTPMLAPDGTLIGVLGIARDITDRKEKEASLEALRKEAEQLSEERGLLLKEVNHRVKNNLAIIIAMLNLEANKRSMEAYSLFIDDIISRVNALGIVHSLLSGNQWRPVMLRDLCQQIIGNTLPRDLNSEILIDKSTLTIAASQAHNMSLVINELSTNTAKYAGNRSDIKVSVAITSEEGWIQFVYQDNGPGYPQSLLDGIIPETGIGLQMVKGIVEMSLSGKLALSNVDGARTEIRFPILSKEE
ncbi:PAS domain S-box-containing protein [Malonomonas rubra DSM 5091]|uniref:histidine kinase n=1 Tax=Malonomonas rubra DSM 5091 TaxID=1122189 RepID=A0A1M6IM84_MALRU|nr:PAS domain S-box protein [Malonomonas rubra]SHJ35560.1 PAS domain S-box-containing protein [Malonomonas rubra DSM 5091]